MNCEHCESQLVSLVEHALPPGEAEEVQAHVSECASCQQSLSRLEMGHQLADFLPQEEPPAAAHARIMEAAHARSAGGAQPAGDTATRPSGGGAWGSFVEWLKGLTLGPQVAMAMVMLLVVAIGLIYLPDLHGRPGAQGEPVVHPDTEGEAAPATSAQAPPGAGTTAAAPEAEQPKAEAAARAESERGGTSLLAESPKGGQATRPSTDHRRSPHLATPRPSRARSARAPRKQAQARSTSGGAGAGGTFAAEDQAAGLGEGSSSTRSAENVAAARAPAAAPTAKAAPAPSPAPPAAASRAPMGVEAEKAAPTRGASPSSGTVASSRTGALLQTARRERAAGNYRSAASAYELYLVETSQSASPHDPVRSQVMLEAADCYRRIGRNDRARYWLTLAAKSPSTAAVAQRQLRALEAPPPAAAATDEAQ